MTRTRPTTHVTLGSCATPYGHALLSLEKLSLAGKYVQKSAPPSYTNVGSSSKEALLVKGRRFVNGGALDLRATCYVRPRAVRGVVVLCAPTLRHPNGNLRQNSPPPSFRTIKSPPPKCKASRKTPPWIKMEKRQAHLIVPNGIGTLTQLSPASRWRRCLVRSMCGFSYAADPRRMGRE
jgi:hypothetical protein